VGKRRDRERNRYRRTDRRARAHETFDISTDLHTRIKVQCAMKGVKVADELRQLLEEHFPARTE
jgi:hypothetical protein